MAALCSSDGIFPLDFWIVPVRGLTRITSFSSNLPRCCDFFCDICARAMVDTLVAAPASPAKTTRLDTFMCFSRGNCFTIRRPSNLPYNKHRAAGVFPAPQPTRAVLAATVAVGSKLREPARDSDQDIVGMPATPEISFRRLGQSELPMLTRWLAEPHVRRFYQKSLVSLEDVNLEYGPAIRGEEPTSCHLAFCDGKPFAYLQCYRNRDYPDWCRIIDVADGISIDLFIGNPAYLGRGLGRTAL